MRVAVADDDEQVGVLLLRLAREIRRRVHVLHIKSLKPILRPALLELGLDYMRSGLLDRAESLFKAEVRIDDRPVRSRKVAGIAADR